MIQKQLFAGISILIVIGLGACAPTAPMVRAPEPVAVLPPIPRVEGPVDIKVAYPGPLLVKPEADSTFIFGTVGTGSAELTINGFRVPVAPNGAFLAFLPVPEDGAYELVARDGRQRHSYSFSYFEPLPARVQPAKRNAETPMVEGTMLGVITEGKDILDTGSEIKYAAPTPGGDRRWFFPRGANLTIIEERGGYYRVRLTGKTEGWTEASGIDLRPLDKTREKVIGEVTVEPAGRHTDLVIPADHAPFHITTGSDELHITIYGRMASGAAISLNETAFIRGLEWASTAPDSSVIRVRFGRPFWGYKAFYDEAGDLVVRMREAPSIDPDAPFRGVRIHVDAGHPPGGAIGPTGLTEAEANLEVSLRLAEMLKERGADVILTRDSPEPIVSATNSAEELWSRVAFAVESDADVLVSIHNNAFPDGVNPFEHYGTETYYYHTFSEALARALYQEIVKTTGLPGLGAKQRSLALVRPTWMPSTLTESLFMMFPQQEAALLNKDFVEDLAAAHLRGLENFLISQAHLEGDMR